ncbi:ribonuclease H protein [Canna indica]|uniref:Ribonuclease H protein n=1 Tax=Canna indica TaxID=4628 RepID=A0AAQ3KG03_9LILI|nr:ribonuclease H protein [Canna indica]
MERWRRASPAAKSSSLRAKYDRWPYHCDVGMQRLAGNGLRVISNVNEFKGRSKSGSKKQMIKVSKKEENGSILKLFSDAAWDGEVKTGIGFVIKHEEQNCITGYLQDIADNSFMRKPRLFGTTMIMQEKRSWVPIVKCELEEVLRNSDVDTIVGGDFNAMRSDTERYNCWGNRPKLDHILAKLGEGGEPTTIGSCPSSSSKQEHFWLRESSFFYTLISCWNSTTGSRNLSPSPTDTWLDKCRRLRLSLRSWSRDLQHHKKAHILEVEKQLETQIAIGEGAEVSSSSSPLLSIFIIRAHLDNCYEVETDRDLSELVAPCSEDEILRNIKLLGKDKAPGPDGLIAEFFLRCWDVIGANVRNIIEELMFDDFLIFTRGGSEDILNLKILLIGFELMTGLKVNFSKTDVTHLLGDSSKAAFVARSLGCQTVDFPIKYLGLPLRNSKLLKLDCRQRNATMADIFATAAENFHLRWRRLVNMDRVEELRGSLTEDECGEHLFKNCASTLDGWFTFQNRTRTDRLAIQEVLMGHACRQLEISQ